MFLTADSLVHAADYYGDLGAVTVCAGQYDNNYGTIRGSVQELGGEAIEADGCVLAAVAGESDGEHLFRALLRPVESVLVKLLPNFYTPPTNVDIIYHTWKGK